MHLSAPNILKHDVSMRPVLVPCHWEPPGCYDSSGGVVVAISKRVLKNSTDATDRPFKRGWFNQNPRHDQHLCRDSYLVLPSDPWIWVPCREPQGFDGIKLVIVDPLEHDMVLYRHGWAPRRKDDFQTFPIVKELRHGHVPCTGTLRWLTVWASSFDCCVTSGEEETREAR